MHADGHIEVDTAHGFYQIPHGLPVHHDIEIGIHAKGLAHPVLHIAGTAPDGGVDLLHVRGEVDHGIPGDAAGVDLPGVGVEHNQHQHVRMVVLIRPADEQEGVDPVLLVGDIVGQLLVHIHARLQQTQPLLLREIRVIGVHGLAIGISDLRWLDNAVPHRPHYQNQAEHHRQYDPHNQERPAGISLLFLLFRRMPPIRRRTRSRMTGLRFLL